jgi:hypothetical protein
MRKVLLLQFALFFLLLPVFSQNLHVLPEKERAAVIDRWLEERIETVLPEIMERTGIDMWVIISREYNEDPVIRTFLPATWHAARRRTILVMYKPKDSNEVETLAIARYDVGNPFKKPGILKLSLINGKDLLKS